MQWLQKETQMEDYNGGYLGHKVKSHLKNNQHKKGWSSSSLVRSSTTKKKGRERETEREREREKERNISFRPAINTLNLFQILYNLKS
jgi:hypothetical protein